MWPITDRLGASLAASGQDVCSRVEILLNGQAALTVEGRTVLDPASGAETGLLNGQVTVDRATVRRRAEIVLADVSDVLSAADADDLIVPLRTEIRPWRGLLYADRTTELPPADREMVPLGTLVVAKVGGTWPTVTLTCYDRMWLLGRYRFTAPYTIPRGTTLSEALAVLIGSRMPADRGPLNLPGLADLTGLIVWDEMDNPAERAHDLAGTGGMQLYADPMGVFTAGPEPSTDDDSVWSFVEGPGSMLLPWPTRELSGEEAYNAMVVTGEPQDGTAPVRGYAENTSPASAMYAGAVGVIPEFFASPLMTTTAQANLAAATLQAKHGLADLTGLSTVVHPALECGDVLYVQASHPAGLAARLIADSFTVPLRGGGPMGITARGKVVFQ